MHVWVEWWSCDDVVVPGVWCGRKCYAVLGPCGEGLVMLSFVVCGVAIQSSIFGIAPLVLQYSISCGVEGRPRVGGFESCRDRGEGPKQQMPVGVRLGRNLNPEPPGRGSSTSCSAWLLNVQ